MLFIYRQANHNSSVYNSSPELTCLISYIENLAVKDAIAGCFLQATALFDIRRTQLSIEP